MPYRFLPHTADLRAAIEAKTLDALFADAAALVRELIAGPDAVVNPRQVRAVALEGETDELLFGFLQELVYAFAVDAFVPASVEIGRTSADRLECAVRGEPFDPIRHEVQPEVKAVTRHGLTVSEWEEGWRAEVVFDV